MVCQNLVRVWRSKGTVPIRAPTMASRTTPATNHAATGSDAASDQSPHHDAVVHDIHDMANWSA